MVRGENTSIVRTGHRICENKWHSGRDNRHAHRHKVRLSLQYIPVHAVSTAAPAIAGGMFVRHESAMAPPANAGYSVRG